MNKHDRMYQQIEKHGADLNAIFNTGMDNVKLCKKLRTLEARAHKLAVDYCNGENGVTSENWESLSDAILVKVDMVLNFTNQEIPVFVNGDARGYAIKIKSEYVKEHNLVIHQDWGGHGIIAPEFDGN